MIAVKFLLLMVYCVMSKGVQISGRPSYGSVSGAVVHSNQVGRMSNIVVWSALWLTMHEELI